MGKTDIIDLLCVFTANLEHRDYYLAKISKLGVLLSGQAILFSK